MDKKERQIRQREFTIYLVLFILLVIVGVITTNGQPIDGRRNDFPYGNPYYYGGYSGSSYGSYSNYTQYGSPYYGGEYGMAPTYAWNQLHGYGNGPPFYPNVQQMYGHQGYGYVHPGFGPQGGQPNWGYYGGQIDQRYGNPHVGYPNSLYGTPAPQMIPPMTIPAQGAYSYWGNEPWKMPLHYPIHPMMGQSAYRGPYNTTPYVECYGQPFHSQMQHPYNQVWW